MLSDTQIQKAVIDELAWTPAVTSSDIGVTAHNGIVTLSGHVPSLWQKRLAEEAAQKVKGVKGVAEEMKVQLSNQGTFSDEKIAEQAVSTLDSDVSVPKEKVKVKVENGWVTLSGEVDWNYQKTSADYSVHRIMGLMGLTNSISVKPHVQPYEVRAQITKALKRTAPFNVDDIKISVDGTAVILSGDVASWYSRDLAMNAAWAVPGVTQVRNDINVVWN